jgi:type I restriction enzyme M protein
MVENVENAMTITQLKSQVDGLRDYLWSSGLPNPGDHVEQISYLLFLKMLEERDDEKAELLGDKYKPIFSGKNDRYRWSKLLDKSGRELLIFVRDELFPFMSKVDSNNEDVSEYFHDAVLKITKPDVLHDLIQKIDNEFPLEMLDNDTKGDLYEYLLSKMDAAGELGQFRTPRHLISFITEMVNPQIGETVVDPACGTGGFLIASYFNILKSNSRPATLKDKKAYWGDLLNDEKRKKLEHSTLYGFDVDQGMIRFARMNLLLHGLEAENVKRRDAIAIEYGQEEDKLYDVVLTNPPFAGRIDKTRIKKDLPIMATKTEILFLGHAIQLLKDNGRCGIIVPEGLLFGDTSAHVDIRRYLLEKCDLQAVISMPSGAFMPYSGVKTSVLIFQKGKPTKKVWFYELDNIGYSLGSKPISIKENDIPDLLEKWKDKKYSEHSWLASTEEILKLDYNLSARTYKPLKANNLKYKEPNKILDEVIELNCSIGKELQELQKMIK